MTTIELFTSYWNLDIIAIIIAAALVIFHYVTNGKSFNKKSFLFLGGITLYLIATCSAISYLGDYYLFSAHMIKDIIILLIVPPLLVSSTNPDFLKKFLNNTKSGKVKRTLLHPVTAWILGVGSMWLWNTPKMFFLLAQSPFLKIVQMISLLVFGIIFIYPVFTPVNYRRLQPLQSALYLFTACVGCTVLGILITFAPAFIYTPYPGGHVFWCCAINTAVPAGSIYSGGSNPAVLDLIQSNWGITDVIDQQMAGLIMWIPACFVYLTNIMISISKWYKLSESEPVVNPKLAAHKLDLS